MFVVTAKGKIFELQRNMHGLVVLRAVGRKLRGKEYLDSTTNQMQVFDGNKKVYGVPIVIDDSIPFKKVGHMTNVVIMSKRTYMEMLKCRAMGFIGEEAFANELLEASRGAKGVT